jgi:hypothetical protein
MGNIDTSTLLWIVGTLFVVISSLIGAIYALIWNAIKDLRATAKSLSEAIAAVQTRIENNCVTKCTAFRDKLDAVQKDCSDRGRSIYDKIETERRERIDKHDAAMDRVFKKIDGNNVTVTQEVKEVRERVEDLRETVSSFGSIYVTRRELGNRSEGG